MTTGSSGNDEVAVGARATEGQRKDAVLHITDIHFWKIVRNPLLLLNKRFLGNINVMLRRRHEFRKERAHEFAEAAASLGIENIVFGGDFTSTATTSEFRLARAFVDGIIERGLRVFVMPGNHDVYTFETVRARRFERFFHDLLPPDGYPARFGLSGGTPLVLVPTVVPNILSSKGRITRRQVEQAADLVRDAPEGVVLVAGHYPMLHRTYAYVTDPGRQLRNAESLRRALGGTGRRVLYMSGHVHRFSYVVDPDYPNLLHLTTSAFFLQRRQDPIQGAFSEILVADQGVEVFQHAYRDAWRREPHTLRENELPGEGAGRKATVADGG